MLTYISIRDELHRLCRERKLLLLGSLLPSSNEPRVIYATPEIYSALVGPWEDRNAERRMGILRRDLDRFLRGERLTVGYGEEESCDLKPLDSQKDVWEFRSRAPKPGIRVFGRFAEQDVLVATNMEYRKNLHHKRSRQWAVEIASCKAEWGRLFPFCHPLIGEKTNDYIRNVTDIADIASR